MEGGISKQRYDCKTEYYTAVKKDVGHPEGAHSHVGKRPRRKTESRKEQDGKIPRTVHTHKGAVKLACKRREKAGSRSLTLVNGGANTHLEMGKSRDRMGEGLPKKLLAAPEVLYVVEEKCFDF